MTCQCDICGRVHDSDQNEYGITDENGTHLVMCGLHAETSLRVAEDNKINTGIMRLATLRLNKLRPSISREPEKWINWHPLDNLIRLYADVLAGKEEEIPETIPDFKPIRLQIKIPGDKVRTISESGLIENELLRLLASCTEREIISEKPDIHISYDEMSFPVQRTERYGTEKYGLTIEGSPIQSTMGVHGEEARMWFHGLPEGIKISAESRLDMRGGDENYFSLEIGGDSIKLPEVVTNMRDNFAGEIKKIIG